MPDFAQTGLVASAIVAAYLWLQLPGLDRFSLQAFVACLGGYLLLKRLSKAKVWHLAPAAETWEMPLLTFAFLLVVGATGNLQSWLFPLTYLHLFFLTLAVPVPTALVATGLMMLFHIGLSPGSFQFDLPHLLSIPIIFVLFVFAKFQYQEVMRDQQIIADQSQTLDKYMQEDLNLEGFLRDFLEPKLLLLQELAADPVTNQQAITGQLQSVLDELADVLAHPSLASQELQEAADVVPSSIV